MRNDFVSRTGLCVFTLLFAASAPFDAFAQGLRAGMSEGTGAASALTGAAIGAMAVEGGNEPAPVAPIPAAPVCDQNLLNELYLHVKAAGCLGTFDHSCGEVLKYVNDTMVTAATVTTGAAGFTTVAAGAYHEMSVNKTKSAMDSLRRGLEIKNTDAINLNKRYSELLRLEDEGKLPKFAKRLRLDPDQTRIALARNLEKYAVGKTLERTMLARKAMQKMLISQAVKRGASYVAMGAGALSGVGAVLGFAFDTTPAGDCNDNGLAFIDKKPSESGGCEMSFSVTGYKVRYFFEQPVEKQLKILKKDPTTCQYYHLMNENLKGHLQNEILTLNNVEFDTMPKCDKDKPNQFTYNVQVGTEGDKKKRPVRVVARTDVETKKIRTLTTSNLDENEEETGVKTVFKFRDENAGSEPYEVESSVRNRKQTDSFEDFMKQAGSSRVVNENIQNLNISQFWSPVIQACCDGNEPDKCMLTKLPGLKENEAPAEVSTKKAIQTPTEGQK